MLAKNASTSGAIGEPVLDLEQLWNRIAAVDVRVDLGAHPARPVEDAALAAGDLGQPRRQHRVKLLPHPRHAEEHRRATLLEIVGELLDRLGEPHGAARGHRHVDRPHLLGDVRERQVRQRCVAVDLAAAAVDQQLRRPRQVGVRQHHALGRTGRARGVDQRRQVGHLDRGEPGVERAVRRTLGAAAEIVPRQHVVADRFRAAHHHDPAQQWQLVPPRSDLGELAGVLDDHGVRLAVVDDVLDLVGRARRVDAGRGTAGHHRRVIEDDPLGAIEAEDGDLAAGRKPERDQRARRGADLIDKRLPRRRLPAAIRLRLIGDLRRIAGRLLEKAM
jgi:hypothetical protein